MKLSRIIAGNGLQGMEGRVHVTGRIVYTLENSKEEGRGRDENGIKLCVG